MSWSVNHIRTNSLGEILVNESFDNLIGDFTIDLERGDQYVIKCADINIEHDLPLPVTSIGFQYDYLAFFWNDNMVECFYYDSEYTTLNETTQRYTSRLYSLQQKFFRNMEAAPIMDGIAAAFPNDNYWSNNFFQLNSGGVQIQAIWSNKSSYSYSNRWAWSINDLLQSMTGAQSKGYWVNQVTTPGPLLASGERVPVLYGGYSSATLADAQDKAFGTVLDPMMTWHDLFRYASILYNATIEARPVVYTRPADPDLLILNVSVTPRAQTLGSVSQVYWYGRTREKNKYAASGLKIQSTATLDSDYPAFLYQLAATYPNKNVIKHELPIYNTASTNISGFSDGHYLAIIPIGLDGSNWVPYIQTFPSAANEMYQYISDYYVAPHYEPFLGVVDGHMGKIQYAGQTIMNVLEEDDQVQVFRLTVSRKAAKGITMAKAEGPRI